MKSVGWIITFFVFSFILSSILFVSSVFAQNFKFSRNIIIDNTNGDALSDYQILVTLDTASFISANKMRTDCGDIRFRDSDKITQLNYWLESGCNLANTKIWVKVPSIPANSKKMIYLYYGDSTVSSISNFFSTMESPPLIVQTSEVRFPRKITDVSLTKQLSYISDMTTDSEDNIIITGSKRECYKESGNEFCSNFNVMVKYNKIGEKLWEKSYVGAVETDSQDNIVLVSGGLTGMGFYIRKFEKNGNLLWQRTYTKEAEQIHVQSAGIAIDSQDNIIITGYIGYRNGDVLIVKYDKNGNFVKEATYGESEFLEKGLSVITDSQDNIIISGHSGFPITTPSASIIIKYDSLLREISHRGWSGLNPRITVDSKDNIIVSGLGLDSYVTRKYTPSFELLWEKSFFTGFPQPLLADIRTYSADDIIIAGSSGKYLPATLDIDWDYTTIKYDSSGNLIWIKTFEQSIDVVKSLVIDSQNMIIVGGDVTSPKNPPYTDVSIIILKYSERKIASPEPQVTVSSETDGRCTRQVLAPTFDYSIRTLYYYDSLTQTCTTPRSEDTAGAINLCDSGWLLQCSLPFVSECAYTSFAGEYRHQLVVGGIDFPSLPAGATITNANFSIYFNGNGCAKIDTTFGRLEAGTRRCVGEGCFNEVCDQPASAQWLTLNNVQNNVLVGTPTRVEIKPYRYYYPQSFGSLETGYPARLEVEYCSPDNIPPIVAISKMDYRRYVKITEQSSKDLFSYPTSISLDTRSLISGGKMKSGCGDIRATDDSGKFLDHWIENCNSENTKAWVKILKLEKGSKETVSLSYGNSLLNSESDKTNTIGNQLVRHWSASTNPYAITTGPNGNIITVTGGQKCKVAKYNSANGNLLWEKELDVGQFVDFCQDVASNNEVIVVVGYTDLGGGQGRRGFVVAFDHNGNEKWRFFNTLVGNYIINELYGVAIRANGQIVASGIFKNSWGEYVAGVTYFKPDDGKVTEYPTFNYGRAYDVDTYGNTIIIAGTLSSSVSNPYDAYRSFLSYCTDTCKSMVTEPGYPVPKIKSDNLGNVLVTYWKLTELTKFSPSLTQLWFKSVSSPLFTIDKSNNNIILSNGTVLDSKGDIIKTKPLADFQPNLLEYDSQSNLIIKTNDQKIMKFSETTSPEPLVEIGSEKTVDWSNLKNIIISMNCDDAGWGCDGSSLKILKSNEVGNPPTCPTDYSLYTVDATKPLFISQDTYICAAAKDRAGNIGFSQPVKVDIDITGPTISATHSLETMDKNSKITIKVTAEDTESGVDKIEIYIDNTLVNSCPTATCEYSGSLDFGAHNYSVKAVDKAGNEALFNQNIYAGATRYSFEFERGWNLFSLPFKQFTINANTCDTANKRFYHWDSAGKKWEIVTGMENLKPVGYWFYTDKKCGISISGRDPILTNDLQTQLRTGWNQIGSVVSDVAANFQSVKGNCMIQMILYYDATSETWKTLNENDLLESYKAYFIKASC